MSYIHVAQNEKCTAHNHYPTNKNCHLLCIIRKYPGLPLVSILRGSMGLLATILSWSMGNFKGLNPTENSSCTEVQLLYLLLCKVYLLPLLQCQHYSGGWQPYQLCKHAFSTTPLTVSKGFFSSMARKQNMGYC